METLLKIELKQKPTASKFISSRLAQRYICPF